jgi:hypothetical protein
MTRCPVCTNHADIYYRYMGNLICADCAAPLRMIGRELEKVET